MYKSCIFNSIHIFVNLRAQSEASEPYFRSVSQDTLKGIVKRLEKFHDVLLNPPKKRPVVTPSFSFEIPFGESRLNVCRLLATIVDTMDFETHLRLIELNTLNVMLVSPISLIIMH